MLAGKTTESARAFNLSPITYDRPSFYAVLRLSEFGTILQRLEMLPQAEIGAAGQSRRAGAGDRDGAGRAGGAAARAAAACARRAAARSARWSISPRSGLGFLFIEIFLIERASFYLNDRTSGFALVLTGMLIFSGLGSMMEHRFEAQSAARRSCSPSASWSFGARVLLFGLQSFMLATLGLPWLVRAAVVVALVAPVSLALGLPFPLGLARVGSGSFLPWAWGLNGAFSVVSTPLANLVACSPGYDRVLLLAMLLYVICIVRLSSRAKEYTIGRNRTPPDPPPAARRRHRRPGRPARHLAGSARRRRRVDPPGLYGRDGEIRPAGGPDRGAVRRHPGAQAGRDEAHRELSEGASRQRRPRGDGRLRGRAARIFPLLYDSHRATPGDAYEDNPKPWALGYGSALSDYLGQAYMTQIAKPKPSDVTLEIGTGSGFQTSLLSRIVSHAYSIEIIEPLGRAVGKIFAPLGYTNIQTRVGDGYYGWPEVKDGFDTIIVTCAAQYAPPDLFKQLKPGGKLIIPIGQPFKRGQFLYVYTKDQEGKIHSRKDVGVFFIPMTGTMMKTPAPGGDQAGAKAPSPSGAPEPIKTSLPASEAVKPAG